MELLKRIARRPSGTILLKGSKLESKGFWPFRKTVSVHYTIGAMLYGRTDGQHHGLLMDGNGNHVGIIYFDDNGVITSDRLPHIEHMLWQVTVIETGGNLTYI